jgi:tape measure domain-containing protein
VAVETEELVLKSNVVAVAMKDAAALGRTADAADKLKSALDGGATKSQILAQEKAVTSELSRQASIAAKVASFDASRAKATSDLSKQLKKLNDDATGKTAADAAKQAAKGAYTKGSDAVRDSKVFAGVKDLTSKIFGKETGDKLGAAGEKLGTALDKIGPGGELLMKGAAGVTLAAAALAAAAVVVAVKLGVAFAGQAIESVSFKKNTMAGLEAMLKSKEAAKATYDDLKKFADLEAPFETKDVAANFKRLLGAGFTASETKDILRGSFDLAALNDGNKEVADQVVNALAKIQGQGKLTGETIEQIITASGGAVSRKGLLAELAKATGKNVDVIEKEMASGKIKADVGVKAILSVIRGGVSGGELGKLSKSLTGNSVSGLLSTIKSQFGGLFEDIDIAPLTDAMKNASGVLSGPLGGKMKSSFTELGTQLFKTLFGPFQGPEGQKRLETLVTRVIDLAGSATSALKAAAPYVQSFVDVMLAFSGADMSGSDNGAASMITYIADVARAAIHPLDTMWKMIEKISGFTPKGVASIASGTGSPVTNPFESVAANDNGSADVGANMALGVAKGVDDNAGSIGDSMVAAVDAAVKRAEATLGVASPAKRLVTTGKWSALGMAKGWNDNAGAVADAAAGTAQMAASAAGGASGAGATSGGSGGAGPQVNITVVIQGGKDPQATAQATAEALGPVIRREIRAWQRDAAESGGSASSKVA